ncbi:MAG: hypothetical protein KA135_06530, partial [Halioglobus sp.]|nr:hypothetical protein [Halioglobus sp.]
PAHPGAEIALGKEVHGHVLSGLETDDQYTPAGLFTLPNVNPPTPGIYLPLDFESFTLIICQSL